MNISAATPPEDFSPPKQALWWLKKGALKLGPEWELAHNVCQTAEGDPAHDWVHALCHLIEGDHDNARYWFRRAGKPVHETDVSILWDEMAASIG